MKDAEHVFFRPLWRRIALVVFCAGWAAFEFWNEQAFWGTLAAGMAAYAAVTFLINYKLPADSATRVAPGSSGESPDAAAAIPDASTKDHPSGIDDSPVKDKE
jgi:hypothetical protein